MPKKVLAGFLLLVLICFSARHLLFKQYLSFQKSKFKTELFKSNNPEVFTIQMKVLNLFKDFDGIEWKDDNKEIVYQGLYHEVLHIEIHNGFANISVIEDKFETKLISSFYSTLSKEDSLYRVLSELLQLTFVDPLLTDECIAFSQMVNHLTAIDANTSPRHVLMVFIPPKA
jgi:hypothetical protein